MIHTPENKLHQIFVQDIEILRSVWSEYMDKPMSTEFLLKTMEHYSERWAEACTEIYMEKYGLNTNTDI
jgi:hypothetical protein